MDGGGGRDMDSLDEAGGCSVTEAPESNGLVDEWLGVTGGRGGTSCCSDIERYEPRMRPCGEG